MTKILFWNIENFGINKVNDPSGAVAPGQGGLASNVASAQRRLVIESVLLDTNPDIFIVVEVSCGGGAAPGALITPTGGGAGCRNLLQMLRTHSPDWRLVPPLAVGSFGLAEGVAVYYRGDAGGGRLRYFTGPNQWLGAASGPPGGAEPRAYPAPWTPALGPTRVVPGAAGHNGGFNEDELAARVVNVAYPLAHGPFAARQREPYYCTFYETGGAAAARNLAVFAIHTSPWGAALYLTAAAPAIALQPAVAAETRIVAADFNVNLLTLAGGFAAPYAAFAGYQPLLRMPGAYPGGAVPSLDSYCGYATTHIKPKKIFGAQCAAFMSTATQPSSYPGLRYSGSGSFGNFYSIDNILISPIPGAPALAAMGTTVVNTVVGTPYVTLPGFNPAAPIVPNTNLPAPGALQIASYFTTTPGGFPWSGAPLGLVPLPFNLATNNELRSWANYGRIRSTSDHFAIYANV